MDSAAIPGLLQRRPTPETGRERPACRLRLFGYTFNPLSAYFSSGANGDLALLVCEVRNTFDDIYRYVLQVRADDVRAVRAPSSPCRW